MSDNSDNSNSDNETNCKPRFKCANCDKSFSFNQGLYKHIKSGACAGIKIELNTDEYLEMLKIDIENYMDYDNVNEIIFSILKSNDLDKLPFIVSNRKLKYIRIKIGDECKTDNLHSKINNFFNAIRLKVIKLIDKNKLLKGNDEADKIISFLNIMLKDISSNNIIDRIFSI